MVSRIPGEGRYAQSEREHRWLLDSFPDDCRDSVEIRDHYVTGTHLRLRRMESDHEVIWKLAQKIRERNDSPEVVKLTNMYLSEQEYQALLTLDTRELSKTRWQWSFSGRTMAADVFHGALTGLVLVEMELDLSDERPGAPPGTIADVTHDDRFSGGALATLSRRDAEVLLRDVNLMRAAGRTM